MLRLVSITSSDAVHVHGGREEEPHLRSQHRDDAECAEQLYQAPGTPHHMFGPAVLP